MEILSIYPDIRLVYQHPNSPIRRPRTQTRPNKLNYKPSKIITSHILTSEIQPSKQLQDYSRFRNNGSECETITSCLPNI